MTHQPKTLIAGVGHRFWSDYSVGPDWLDRLAKLEWPQNVTLQDYSFGAWAMTQQLQDDKYERCIFIAAEPRGREPASIHLYPYRFDDSNFDPLRVHDHMFEAVAGVISIDLLLVIAGHFKALPKDTWVIELEPANVSVVGGHGLSQAIEEKYHEVETLVKTLVRGEVPRHETQSTIALGAYGQLARQKGVVN